MYGISFVHASEFSVFKKPDTSYWFVGQFDELPLPGLNLAAAGRELTIERNQQFGDESVFVLRRESETASSGSIRTARQNLNELTVR